MSMDDEELSELTSHDDEPTISSHFTSEDVPEAAVVTTSTSSTTCHTNPFVQALGQAPKVPKDSLVQNALVKIAAGVSKKKEWGVKDTSNVKSLVDAANSGTQQLWEKLLSVTSQAKDLHRVAADGMNRGKDQLDKAAKAVLTLTDKVNKVEKERDILGREVQKLEGNAKVEKQLMTMKDDVVKDLKGKVAELKEDVSKKDKKIGTLEDQLAKAEKKLKDNNLEEYEKRKVIDVKAHQAKIRASRADKDRADGKKKRERQSRLEGVAGGGGFDDDMLDSYSVSIHCSYHLFISLHLT